MNRKLAVALGLVAVFAETALWHGPAGTADRLSARIEQDSRQRLVDFEMQAVTARLERAPLSRKLVLSGPADDFQRGELVRILGTIPGVSQARWTVGGFSVPLLVEAWIASIAGFLLGLLVFYLIELRRRANAEWRW